jgi:hypothetical protein
LLVLTVLGQPAISWLTVRAAVKGLNIPQAAVGGWVKGDLNPGFKIKGPLHYFWDSPVFYFI